MTDNPSRQAIAARERTASGAVTGKLRDALTAMIHEGLTYQEAAGKFNLTARAMRSAMGRPHVIAFLKRERQVLLASLSGRTVLRLGELLEQDENKQAAVAAARTLEGMSEEAMHLATRAPITPGMLIIVNHPAPTPAADRAGLVIDVSPNKAADDDGEP